MPTYTTGYYNGTYGTQIPIRTDILGSPNGGAVLNPYAGSVTVAAGSFVNNYVPGTGLVTPSYAPGVMMPLYSSGYVPVTTTLAPPASVATVTYPNQPIQAALPTTTYLTPQVTALPTTYIPGSSYIAPSVYSSIATRLIY